MLLVCHLRPFYSLSNFLSKVEAWVSPCSHGLNSRWRHHALEWCTSNVLWQFGFKEKWVLLTWSCTPAWRWNTLWGAGTRDFPSVGIVFQGIQASTPKGRWHTLCWSSLCRRSRPKRGIWWSGVDPPPRKASSGRKTDRGCHRRLEKKEKSMFRCQGIMNKHKVLNGLGFLRLTLTTTKQSNLIFCYLFLIEFWSISDAREST